MYIGNKIALMTTIQKTFISKIYKNTFVSLFIWSQVIKMNVITSSNKHLQAKMLRDIDSQSIQRYIHYCTGMTSNRTISWNQWGVIPIPETHSNWSSLEAKRSDLYSSGVSGIDPTKILQWRGRIIFKS